MKNIDIVIRHSGLLEKFGCTVEDIKQSYRLWDAGRCFPLNDDAPTDIFFNMMGKMPGTLESVNDCFERGIQQTKEYMLECEIKKANGTFDAWQADLERQMPDEFVESFFSAFNRSQPANSNLSKFS